MIFIYELDVYPPKTYLPPKNERSRSRLSKVRAFTKRQTDRHTEDRGHSTPHSRVIKWHGGGIWRLGYIRLTLTPVVAAAAVTLTVTLTYLASFVVHAEPILDRTRSLCCRFAQIVNRIVRMLMCIVVTSQAQTMDHAASHAH